MRSGWWPYPHARRGMIRPASNCRRLAASDVAPSTGNDPHGGQQPSVPPQDTERGGRLVGACAPESGRSAPLAPASGGRSGRGGRVSRSRRAAHRRRARHPARVGGRRRSPRTAVAEPRSRYDGDIDAPSAMAADERIHEEVVRALAAGGRNRLSGSFRAAVFGANDGLVSNLALVLGISATGVSNHTVLVTGVAGLLAGALSMGAGEYVSVSSQRELLAASTPKPQAGSALLQLDVEANELALVYRARGMTTADAEAHATEVLGNLTSSLIEYSGAAGISTDGHEAVGTGLGAAVSSFCFFASGALVPVLPYLFGLQGTLALVAAAALLGIALRPTGAVVALLSGGPPLRRAMRQLLIGYGAATITYLLGLLVGTGMG